LVLVLVGDDRSGCGLVGGGRTPDEKEIVAGHGGNVFPVRINAPAEIIHITLRRAEAQG
jgi:hypothetical protein